MLFNFKPKHTNQQQVLQLTPVLTETVTGSLKYRDEGIFYIKLRNHQRLPYFVKYKVFSPFQRCI